MPSASHTVSPGTAPSMTDITTRRECAARARDQAVYTTEAVAILLMALGEASHDKGNIHLALDWLGRQLEQAGMVLSGGAE